jgi:hypothetical protein
MDEVGGPGELTFVPSGSTLDPCISWLAGREAVENCGVEGDSTGVDSNED